MQRLRSTLCATGAVLAAVALFFVVDRAKQAPTESAPVAIAADPPRASRPGLRTGALRPRSGTSPEVLPETVRFKSSPRADRLRKQIAEFVRAEHLTAEEEERFLLALYDAQEALKAAPDEAAMSDRDLVEIRVDARVEFAVALVAIFDGPRLSGILSRWNLHSLLTEAELSGALMIARGQP